MSDFGEKLDKIVELSCEEDLQIFGKPKKKSTWFETMPVPEPTRDYHFIVLNFKGVPIITLLTEAIEQAELFLTQFPSHVPPPEYVFENTMSAFMHRRASEQIEFDLYFRMNMKDIKLVKLCVEYKIVIRSLTSLLESFRNTQSFKKFEMIVNEMLELEEYLIDLERENVYNIGLLRTQEMQLIKLCQSYQTSKEFKALDVEYQAIENEYHDSRIIRAAQLRFNKNMYNNEICQAKKREANKTNDMIDETNEYMRNVDIESVVFEESSRYNLLMIEQYKQQIQEIIEKYETDLGHKEIEITKLQSDINYFEEMWERKRLELQFMNNECEKYIESVRQRKREAIAKRLVQPWIAAARNAVATRRKKAKRAAKKNKKTK